MAKKSTKEKDFKYLVIVESPAKSKTLTKILGEDYLVKSSVGHIRDLPSKGLGINVKENFEPTYEVMSGKQKVVDELNTYAKKAEIVYLASDPDREGEAIAWHLSHILKCRKKDILRIAFNQITPGAVREAVQTPRDIDIDLVNAQQARRILDRLVGYKISPILWRKIGGRSAGRVQSIAVRLICEREEEIQAFTPEEYWSIDADVNDSKDTNKQSFLVNLTHVDKKRIISPVKESDPAKNIIIRSEDEVNSILERAKKADLKVASVNSRPGTRKAKAPFKTSTLQRAASNALGYTVKKTMQVAQTLYEGVRLGKGASGDLVGLITYMRTDSQRLSQEALDMAKDYILETWGPDYYPGEPTYYDKKKATKKDDEKAKAKEQDAHEAIRPTYADKTPDSIKAFLTPDQYRLYKLIWERFVACQMSPMKIETKTVEIKSEEEDLNFRASSSKTVFPGYYAAYGGAKEASEEDEAKESNSKFPETIAVGNKINVLDLKSAQHFTEGPPRYNEASLVKALEELGIGRPSTYAPTIATVLDRKYVEKTESNALIPTKLGINVNNLLVDHFGRYINVEFTSNMESRLDEISENKLEWHNMLKEFYLGRNFKQKLKDAKKKKPRKKKKDADAEAKEEPQEKEEDMGFIDIVKKASKEIENVVIETEHKCPKCSAVMYLRSSRFGPFLGCSKYPDCDGIVNLTKEGTPAPDDKPYTEENCPKCEAEGSLVLRYGRYGIYIACTTDGCGHTAPLVKKTGIKCPREGCEGEIVEKKSRFGKIFYGCDSWSKTQCDVVFWNPPILEKCPDCGKLLTYKTLKRGDKIACPDTKGCGYNRLATEAEKQKYSPALKDGGSEDGSQKSVFSI